MRQHLRLPLVAAALPLVPAWTAAIGCSSPEQPDTLSFQSAAAALPGALIQEGANRAQWCWSQNPATDADFPWKVTALIGLPGYRPLAHSSGRFLAPRAAVPWGRLPGLSQSPLGPDLWRWLRRGEHDLFLF